MGEIIITVPKKKHRVQIVKSEAVLNDFLAKQEASIKEKFGVYDLDLSAKDGLEDIIPEETTPSVDEVIFDADLLTAQNRIENKISAQLLEKNDLIDINDDIEPTYIDNPVNKIVFTEIYTISDDVEPIQISNDFETKNMVIADDLEKQIQNAYNKGYDDAKEVALLNAREKVLESHNYIRRIDSFMMKLREHYINQTQIAREKIIEIGKTIAEIILETEIKKENNFIIQQITKIWNEINNEKIFSIRINPADYNILMKAKSILLDGDNFVSFIKDDSIKKGGCVLNTALGSIDATISTQIEKLKNEIIAIERENIPTNEVLANSAVPDITPIPESILIQ
jgi:flagellar assembly protein FliH